MRCRNCDIVNEEDALYCKRCGALLVEKKSKTKEAKPKKQKTKVKRKTKIKKIYQIKKNNQKQENSIGKNILILFLLILVIVLMGLSFVMGYHIYNEEKNIEVPDLYQLSYEEAVDVLAKKNLKIEQTEKIVTDEEKSNIVINQNKRKGTKVSKNTVIKVTVGKYQFSYIVANWIGNNKDEVKNELNHKGILYQLEEKEVEEERDHNKVIEQSPKKGTKVDHSVTIKIIVGKYNAEKKEKNNDNKEL